MVGRLPEGIIQEIKSQRHNFNQCDSHLTGTTYLAFTFEIEKIKEHDTVTVLQAGDILPVTIIFLNKYPSIFWIQIN